VALLNMPNVLYLKLTLRGAIQDDDVENDDGDVGAPSMQRLSATAAAIVAESRLMIPVRSRLAPRQKQRRRRKRQLGGGVVAVTRLYFRAVHG